MGGLYDFSVDIWSLGMLALQCLLVDSIEHSPLGQDCVDAFLKDAFGRQDSEVPCSADGRAFIRSCLSYDPAQRPTAEAALQHAWLCEPREDLELFERRQQQFASFRKPRSVTVPVIQYIEPTGTVPQSGTVAADLGCEKAAVSISAPFAGNRVQANASDMGRIRVR
jgi:serine/threonine protein kinase